MGEGLGAMPRASLPPRPLSPQIGHFNPHTFNTYVELGVELGDLRLWTAPI